MSASRALVLIYDIRGFTAASRRLSSKDLGAFATGAHRAILDLFAARPPTFVKHLGDGHLLLWETSDPPDPDLVATVVHAAARAQTAFAAYVAGHATSGAHVPRHVGVGVAHGEVTRSDDYYGVALNLAARLQNLARPEGLALDRGVFELAGRQDERLRTAFRRARVRLKGLGSTLVWVARPFSWRRLLAPVATAAAVLALPLAYALACDAGAALPGAGAVRDALDARGWTVFRRVPTAAEVASRAAAVRADLARRLVGRRTPAGWVLPSYQSKPDELLDVWSSSQAIAALLKTPEVPLEDARALLGGLRAPFEPDQWVERDGVAYGWVAHPGYTHTEAEPALWTATALAVALGRPGLVPDAERAAFVERLERAQRAAATHRPLDTGGWNIFPRQTDPAVHSPYTTSLALLCLLETHTAGLPWLGSERQRDRLIAKTVRYVGDTFLPAGDLPGWRRTGDSNEPVSLGLTLQNYALLLRAEAELSQPIPERIASEIPRRLASLVGTSLQQQADAGEFRLEFTNHEGRKEARAEGINFLWHPWAVEACHRWLAYDAKQPGPKATRERVARTLGHLVLEMGPAVVETASKGYVFVSSETVFCFAALAR